MLNTCQAQRDLIRQSIIHNIRIDGRTNSTKRTPIIKTDVIAHLPGSSYIYLEYQNIEIYTGIKIKIQQVNTVSNQNQIALQLSSMRKLQDKQTQQLQYIQSILQKIFISKLVNSKQLSKLLSITGSKKHQLQLYIDVFLLTSPHISQLELIITGIKTALQCTSFAKVQVAYNQVTEQETVQLSKQKINFVKDSWEQVYIIGLVQSKQGSNFVVDLKQEEYDSMDVCFLVVADLQKIKYIETIKGKSSVETINRCTKFALASLIRK